MSLSWRRETRGLFSASLQSAYNIVVGNGIIRTLCQHINNITGRPLWRVEGRYRMMVGGIAGGQPVIET